MISSPEWRNLKSTTEGTIYQDFFRELIRSNDPRFIAIQDKFRRWGNKNALIFKSACGIGMSSQVNTCASALQTVQNRLIDVGPDKYLQEIIEKNNKRPGFTEDKEALKNSYQVQNTTDLLTDDINLYPDLAVISLAEGRNIFWFSVKDFPTLLEKKKNPYNNNVSLPQQFMDEIVTRLSVLNSYGIKIEEIQPLNEVLNILTKINEVLPSEEVKFEKKVSIAELLADELHNLYVDKADIINLQGLPLRLKQDFIGYRIQGLQGIGNVTTRDELYQVLYNAIKNNSSPAGPRQGIAFVLREFFKNPTGQGVGNREKERIWNGGWGVWGRGRRMGGNSS